MSYSHEHSYGGPYRWAMYRRISILGCVWFILGCGEVSPPHNPLSTASTSATSEELQNSNGRAVDLHNTELTPEIKEHLSTLPHLQELTLPSGFKAADLPWLGRMQTLHVLNIDSADLRDADFTSLAGLQDLSSLSLRNCRFSNADFATFPRLERIATLTLSGGAITDACAERLAELRLPALRTLSLEETSLTDAGIRSLCGVYNLEWLNLYCSRGITAESVAEIGKMDRLGLVGIGGTGMAPRYTETAAVTELRRLLPTCRVDFGD